MHLLLTPKHMGHNSCSLSCSVPFPLCPTPKHCQLPPRARLVFPQDQTDWGHLKGVFPLPSGSIQNIPVFLSPSPTPFLGHRKYFSTLLLQAPMIQTFVHSLGFYSINYQFSCHFKTSFECLFWQSARSSQFLWGARHKSIFLHLQILPLCGPLAPACKHTSVSLL